MGKRLAVAWLLVVAAGVFAALALRTATPSAFAASCGGERWKVKTLGDRPQLLPVQPTTVRFLVTRPRPPSLPDTRLPFERHIFRIVARVAFVRPEADSDLHVGVVDGAGRTMIAEAPLPACAVGATPMRKRQMGLARSKVRVCAKAVLTGVAFFDFPHGQTGVARNAIELHPLLGFRCLA